MSEKPQNGPEHDPLTLVAPGVAVQGPDGGYVTTGYELRTSEGAVIKTEQPITVHGVVALANDALERAQKLESRLAKLVIACEWFKRKAEYYTAGDVKTDDGYKKHCTALAAAKPEAPRKEPER